MGAQDLSKLFEKTLFFYFEKEINKVEENKVTQEFLIKELTLLKSKIQSLENESEFFNSQKALELIGWSYELLDRLNEFDNKVKLDVMASISYFVNSDDMISDEDIFEGYDDDYIVMKNVIEYHNIVLKK